MNDIYLGFAILALVSCGLFWASRRLVRGRSSRFCAWTSLTIVLLGAAYVLLLRNTVLLAKLLPFSNLIVIGEWLPLALASLGGIAWATTPGGVIRKSIPVAGLVAAGGLAAVFPLLGQKPRCGNNWDADGVCLQASPTTCTPACAATLLRMHGIESSESELAALCFTNKHGTTWQGLYRALKRKTAETPYRVEVFSGSVEDLKAMTPGRLILTVGLLKNADVDPIYHQQWGWTPGRLHTVMLLDFVENQRVEIIDPDVGREQWTVEDLQVLWRGRGMRLVRSNSAAAPNAQTDRPSREGPAD